MVGAEAFGDEAVERLADGLVGAAAEHPLGGAVEEDDVLRFVHGDDGVHRRVNDSRKARLALAQSLLGPPALGDVDDARQHERAFVSADGVEADLDGHFAAVLAEAIKVAARAHRAAGRMPEEAGAEAGVSAPVTLRY